jgi:hypothetical protein
MEIFIRVGDHLAKETCVAFPFSRIKKSANDVILGTRFPVKQAPRFKRGFTFSTIGFMVQFGITGLVWWLWRRENRNQTKSELERRVAGGEDETDPFIDSM